MKALRIKSVTRRFRHASWDVGNWLYRKVRRPLPGEFQPYYYTRPDRYPWLFGFAAARIGARRDVRILSFGCSRGDEVFSLRRYLTNWMVQSKWPHRVTTNFACWSVPFLPIQTSRKFSKVGQLRTSLLFVLGHLTFSSFNSAVGRTNNVFGTIM